jgi:hypothetical protein
MRRSCSDSPVTASQTDKVFGSDKGFEVFNRDLNECFQQNRHYANPLNQRSAGLFPEPSLSKRRHCLAIGLEDAPDDFALG